MNLDGTYVRVRGGETFWTFPEGGRKNFDLINFFFNVPKTQFHHIFGAFGTLFIFGLRGGAKKIQTRCDRRGGENFQTRRDRRGGAKNSRHVLKWGENF